MKCREGSNLSAVISVSSVGDKEWPVRRLRILGRTDGQVESERGPGRESHTNSAVKSFIMSAMVLY